MIKQKCVLLSKYDGQMHNFLFYSNKESLSGYLADGWILKFSEKQDDSKIVMVFERDETPDEKRNSLRQD